MKSKKDNKPFVNNINDETAKQEFSVKEENYEGMFEFVQKDDKIFDKKFDTKPIGYFKDAMLRFTKNKGSVVAAIIILILVLFAIIVPIASPYDVKYRDLFYQKVLPRNQFFEKMGFWDGSTKKEINSKDYDYFYGIGVENQNKYQPIQKSSSYMFTEKRPNGTIKEELYYKVKMNTYYQVGYEYKNLTEEEYFNLLDYQNTTGKQVLYPMINIDHKQFASISLQGYNIPKDEANYWYVVTNTLGAAAKDENGNYIPCYYSNKSYEKWKAIEDYKNYDYSYNSLRIAGDPGIENSEADDAYIYFLPNQSGYRVRVIYYEYYTYINGHEPYFWLGVNGEGQDILVCLGSGARLSFLLAICVSVINLVLGAIYGAIEGYYGGAVDMFMERVSDVLSGVPFIVVATLFQMHLAKKVGVVPSLLFAFVLTGWIGTASNVRTQFYRFKGQEYVLAARTLGAKDSRLIVKHIFPNTLGTLITSSVLVIPGVIFSESSLSYLGIIDFTNSNLTSIGTLLSQGNAAFPDYPHIVLFPAIFIALLMISFNLFGNGLRDAFNPALRGADE